jgi:hypothetical protein
MNQSNGTSAFWSGSIASDAEIDQLLHPSRFYERPADVVVDDLLTVDERRAILSSWASDACAVESNPALRQPPHASSPVTFDEIMDALVQLERPRTSAPRDAPLSGLPRRNLSGSAGAA